MAKVGFWLKNEPKVPGGGGKYRKSTRKDAGMDSGDAIFDASKYHHLSNRSIDGKVIFSSQQDFDRFEAYLYLLNAVEGERASNFFIKGREKSVFESSRGEKLIAIGAYSFTPTDFQILAIPLISGGISRFMQKLQTAYTMYFNNKYHHEGRIFYASYRAHFPDSPADLKYIFSNVHLSVSKLFDKYWSDAEGNELRSLAARALSYRYSSAHEYVTSKFMITSPLEFPKYFSRTKDADAHIQLWLPHRMSGRAGRQK